MLVAGAVATALVVGILFALDSPTAAPPSAQHGSERAPVRSPHGSERAPVRLPALGVQFHATWSHYTRRERNAVLDRIEASGARWVRVDVGWAMLQPEPGRFDRQWAVPKVDGVIRDLRRRGLKVVVMFWLTPAWATAETDPVLAPYTSPDDPQDYADALGWAVRRWGHVVDAWEIWNEPNLEEFYVGTDPRTYADLLCRSAEAVRRRDRDARVVLGGLMYNDDRWLERAYRAGIGGCFDVMAVHAYQAPADAPPSASDDGEVWNLTHLDAVRETMLANGDRLPVWVTEFGWSVHENDVDTESWRRGVDERQQAAYARRALVLMGREYRYVRAAFWYKDAVDDTSTDEHQEGYAMLDEDLRPRRVFRTFAEMYGRP